MGIGQPDQVTTGQLETARVEGIWQTSASKLLKNKYNLYNMPGSNALAAKKYGPLRL